ncbi:MAG: hypothetical protein KBD04_06495 [Proteobacteria bacterium]|nr:hypothetical protein [Pseudomonadota bacterium]
MIKINLVTRMGNFEMNAFVLLFLAQSCCYLWSISELAEIRSYWGDIENCLKNWPACRTYASQEIQMNNTEISQLMVTMNKMLIRCNRFKNSCSKGYEIAEAIKTPAQVMQFVEEYDLFEMNIQDHSNEKIFSMHLKYMGVFLAKPSIMSAFSGDREFGIPYYKAITDPIYLYLKGIKEELEYVAGTLGRLSADMIQLAKEEESSFFRNLWTQFFRSA